MPRKVAFSAKAKKKQLQAKREEKRDLPFGEKREKVKFVPLRSDDDPHASSAILPATRSINEQPGRSRNINRYNLKFHVETKEEIEARKEQARQAIIPGSDTDLEQGSDFCFISGLEFPKRPQWNYSISQQELDMKENKYFREYVDHIEKTYSSSELSYFELNLETWRQLWRVLEMSDIVLIVVDARFPNLLFPPSVYTFVTEELKRDVILVMNKIDLVPATVILGWKLYFEKQFPHLKIVFFTSLPSYNLREGQRGGLKGQRRKGRMRMAAEGSLNLLQVCEELCGNNVDLSAWRKKIEEEIAEHDAESDLEVGEIIQSKKNDTSYHKQETRFLNGMLTIGCIGQPNVGKSSLINGLMGKKVVSVSKTPGHTKHFQTIFLTPNVRLCDCPGLVFPSKLPRSLQVLVGSYPIAHLREPYTAVGYLGKYMDLPKILHIDHPSGEKPDPDETLEWSAYDICEGWAIKRGFMTKKGARPDVARAANHLLRFALEGRICLYMRPPNYTMEKHQLEAHPELGTVIKIQALNEIDKNDEPWQDEEESQEEDNEADQEDESTESGSSEREEETQTNQNKFALLGDDE